MPDKLLPRGDLQFFSQDGTARILHRNRSRVTIPFNPALPEGAWRVNRVSFADFVKADFQTAGTGVKHESFHIVSGSSGV